MSSVLESAYMSSFLVTYKWWTFYEPEMGFSAETERWKRDKKILAKRGWKYTMGCQEA